MGLPGRPTRDGSLQKLTGFVVGSIRKIGRSASGQHRPKKPTRHRRHFEGCRQSPFHSICDTARNGQMAGVAGTDSRPVPWVGPAVVGHRIGHDAVGFKCGVSFRPRHANFGWDGLMTRRSRRSFRSAAGSRTTIGASEDQAQKTDSKHGSPFCPSGVVIAPAGAG